MKRSEQEVREAVDQIFEEVFEIERDRLHPEAQLFADLGLDSIDAIDLAIAFERKFNVKVDQDLIRSIRTLQDVYSAAFERQDSASAEATREEALPAESSPRPDSLETVGPNPDSSSRQRG